MAQISTSTWSEVANNNNAATPDGWPEGQAPSTVNNCAREVMSAAKIDFNQRNPTVTSGGTANVQTLTYTTAPTAYARQTFSFVAGLTNTGPCTLNVNSVGALAIFSNGRALAGGEIVAGQVYQVQHDGTQFQMSSPTSLVSSPYGFKNIIINGDFQVQQRGAGGALSMSILASTPQYTFDRWYFTNGANQASGVSANTGANVGAPQSRFSALVQRTAGQTGTGTMTFQAPLTTDQLAAIVGRIVTLSFKINFGGTFITNNSAGITAALYMGTGAEGRRGAGFSTETSTCSITTTVGGTGATLSATSAAVVPTTTTQGCILFSWTPTATAGASDFFLLTEVQLEVGGVATSFDRRPFDVELARCQRFFTKTFQYSISPAQNLTSLVGALPVNLSTGASGQFGINWQFPTRMRTAPSITTYSTSAANANWWDNTNSAARTVTVGSTADGNVNILGAGGVAGSNNFIQAIADADL